MSQDESEAFENKPRLEHTLKPSKQKQKGSNLKPNNIQCECPTIFCQKKSQNFNLSVKHSHEKRNKFGGVGVGEEFLAKHSKTTIKEVNENAGKNYGPHNRKNTQKDNFSSFFFSFPLSFKRRGRWNRKLAARFLGLENV